MPNQNAARAAAPLDPQIITSTTVTPWRERPLLPMREAAGIAGISPATIYALAAKGDLKLRRFGGRTLVETCSLIAALEGAAAWTPSDRNGKAVAARAERSRAAWAD